MSFIDVLKKETTLYNSFCIIRFEKMLKIVFKINIIYKLGHEKILKQCKFSEECHMNKDH